MTLLSSLDLPIFPKPDQVHCSALQKLAELHADLAKADEKWLDASTASKRVNGLIARIDEFWRDLPQVREPVLAAADRASLQMKIIIAACAHDKTLSHSWAVRTLLRDTLDDLCIVITTYRAGFQND